MPIPRFITRKPFTGIHVTYLYYNTACCALACVRIYCRHRDRVYAAGDTPVGENTGWVRARLDYEYDEGITGLDDSIIDFADGWEKKDDGWYYYKSSVKPGDKIRFITCVHVPAEWTEKLENKKFCIIATAELSEVAPKDSGWDATPHIQELRV